MACLQQGLKPRTKQMEEGSDPVAVAFGTNFVRRRLNSVQKAFYGATFALDTDAKQAEVAKIVGCNLNRLNQCCQLLKRDDAEAKEAVDKLRANPEISGAVFEEMLAELGIARSSPPPAPASGPARSNTYVDDDLDDVLGSGDDDLTGGAIDNLFDDPDEPSEGMAPATRKPREIGEGSDPLPTTGSKPSSQTRAQETMPSRMAKAFRSLAPEEQINFVVFAGTKLAVAVNAALGKKKFTLEIAPHEETPKPTKGKKASGESSKPDPSIIATPVKKTTAPKGKAAKAAAAKKTPAKKAASKK
jgi:hypothetical protein